MLSRLGVVGWPVAHSRSPEIQNAALAAAGLARGWHYQRLPVPPELFVETVRALPHAGFRGVNVTIPHKEAALALADRASETAYGAGAANTLLFDRDGSGRMTVYAENTDAPAIVEALPFAAAGCSALVLGAGGSARAAVWALTRAGADVTVWNRTATRAVRLAGELGARAVAEPGPADVIVNCTSVGLEAAGRTIDRSSGGLNLLPVPADLIDTSRCVIDLVYSSSDTPLVRAARARAVPVVTGLEILVEQGALAFARFTGRPASRAAMRAAVGLEP